MDIYRENLLVLRQIFEKERLDKWRDWMQKDILRWDNQHSAQHHLKAYGGVGTLNDLRIGGNSPEQHWRGAVFDFTKKVAWAYASQHEGGAKADLLQIINSFENSLNAWQCGNCKHTAVRGIDVERYVARSLVGRVFGELVLKNDLHSIVEFETYAAVAGPVKSKLLEELNERNQKVYLEVVDWFRKCAVCDSGDLTHRVMELR